MSKAKLILMAGAAAAIACGVFLIAKPSEIQVGLYGPFSGFDMKAGTDFKKGFDFAVENQKGFFKRNVTLHSLDTESDSFKVQPVVEQLIKICNCNLVIGDTSPERSVKGAALIGDRIQIQPLGADKSATTSENKSIVYAEPLEREVQLLSRLVKDQLKLNKIDFISAPAKNGASRRIVDQSAEIASPENTKSFSDIDVMKPNDRFWTEISGKAVTLPEAIVLDTSVQIAGALIKRLRQGNYKGQIIFIQGLRDDDLRLHADKDALGTYVIGYFDPKVRDPEIKSFAELYEKKYSSPATAWAAIGSQIAKIVIEDHGGADEAAKIRNAIESLKLAKSPFVYRIDADESTVVLK